MAAAYRNGRIAEIEAAMYRAFLVSCCAVIVSASVVSAHDREPAPMGRECAACSSEVANDAHRDQPLLPIIGTSGGLSIRSSATSTVEPPPTPPLEYSRPGPLPALYVSLVALQGYDVYSTLTVLSSGGVEKNPLMKNTGGSVALKVGATTLAIVASERLWKGHHRTAAVATMILSNGLLAVVAAHNTRVMATIR